MRLFWLAVSLLVVTSVKAQQSDYDFDFVTITHPGNPGFGREPTNAVHRGRGSVGYEYRIAATEITTSQWMEFANVLAGRGQVWAARIDPSRWGAMYDLSAPPGSPQFMLNPGLPDAGNVPVGGISFGQAAVFANWLHNGKQTDDASLTSGAYSVNWLNFGSPIVTQFAHLPDARFWVPTMDEWLKAAYWDPNKTEHDGWWLYPHMSDEVPVAGPPGVGETNTGYLDTLLDWHEFRVGEYTQTLSPWGLLDATGGAREWTETVADNGFGDIVVKGGVLGRDGFTNGLSFDHINAASLVSPNSGGITIGLRIASAVPTPSGVVLFVGVSALALRRSRLSYTAA